MNTTCSDTLTLTRPDDWHLHLRDGADLSGLPLPAHETLRALDATLLHGAILEGVLGSALAAPGNLAFDADLRQRQQDALAGLPALALPCGFEDGLPVSLQLVGPPLSEARLLSAGALLQARTDFHRPRPPL